VTVSSLIGCFESQAKVFNYDEDVSALAFISWIQILLAQRSITLVLMMINSCSYSTNDLVLFKF